MPTPHLLSAQAYFDSELDVSVSELLAKLRHHLRMDVLFVGKFEEGHRTSVFIDAEQASEGACFSHPFEQTYCKKIVDGELPEVIPDARQHHITRNMAVTEELSIGAYLGVPIHLSDGEVYGTLCGFKHEGDPSLADRDASLLHFIAELIADKVEGLRNAELRSSRIRRRLERMAGVDALEMHLQPIWSVRDDRICGYEALSRFQTEPYLSPTIWFRDAEDIGQDDGLERLSIARALAELGRLPADCFLSINASPKAILAGVVADAIERADPHRLVVEVTEHAKIRDYRALRQAMDRLRRKGVRLAIDDAGSGYASFQHILELNVDVIKLDLSLIRDIHASTKKRALAGALIAYARQMDIMVVAEGVECQQEFETLRDLEVDKIQGFYIGKPVPFGEPGGGR